jgi:hypothetical protein
MPNLTSVTVTSGVPTAGTGTVSTIDALMADGGQVTLGAKADAKSTASDTTAITAMSVWKQISFSIQAAATSLATLVSDVATIYTTSQTISAGAQLTTLPTDQDWTSLKTASRAAAGDYETVAASQTDQVMGATGGTGDYLRELLIIPGTTSPGAVSIKDGSGSAITVFTGGATSVSNLVPFSVSVGAVSTGGAWKITTGTNVTAIGVGKFT